MLEESFESACGASVASSVTAETEYVTPLEAPTPVRLSVASSSKTFEPIIVKVNDEVAHIVGRIGETLVYVETSVAEMCAPAKMSVLGKIAGAQAQVKVVIDPVAMRATSAIKPMVDKVEAAYASTKAKAITMASPVYTKVIDGVVYVQGIVGNAKICFQARATETWSFAVSNASSTYVAAYHAADNRVRPMWVWTSSKTMLAKDYVQAAVEPYWIRSRDGCLYIQASVGNMLVRIKVCTQDASNRTTTQILAAYASVYGAINSYTAPLIAKIVSIYSSAKAQSLAILWPYLDKARSTVGYVSTSVNGLVVGVKVRAASFRDMAVAQQSACYMKFKNGFIYVHGLVGDKVVSIKVSLKEILSSLNSKVTIINCEAKARLLGAKSRIQDAACSATQLAKSTVKDRGAQVTAASALGGAAAMGASGGFAGLTTGTVIGAACGVVPALFTFGLSIPIGAVVGGTTGLCAGTVAGGSVGLVGGGAAGRSVHKNQDKIRDGMTATVSKASGCKDYMTEKTKGYKDFVIGKSADLRTRIVGGTGGTA
jgi:hypothetical protein